jgi:hypothetical protein
LGFVDEFEEFEERSTGEGELGEGRSDVDEEGATRERERVTRWELLSMTDEE